MRVTSQPSLCRRSSASLSCNSVVTTFALATPGRRGSRYVITKAIELAQLIAGSYGITDTTEQPRKVPTEGLGHSSVRDTNYPGGCLRGDTSIGEAFETQGAPQCHSSARESTESSSKLSSHAASGSPRYKRCSGSATPPSVT